MQINEFYGMSADAQLDILMQSVRAASRKIMQLMQDRYKPGTELLYRTDYMDAPHKATVQAVEWRGQTAGIQVMDHVHGLPTTIYHEHVCHENA